MQKLNCNQCKEASGYEQQRRMHAAHADVPTHQPVRLIMPLHIAACLYVCANVQVCLHAFVFLCQTV